MSESGLIEHGPRARRQRVSYKTSRRSGDYAFRDAVRHSTRVRWLKILLPALAIAGAGLFCGTLRLIPDGFAELVSFGGIDIESNSVIMESPHISGFEGTRRAYEVKAVRAVPASGLMRRERRSSPQRLVPTTAIGTRSACATASPSRPQTVTRQDSPLPISISAPVNWSPISHWKSVPPTVC